MSMAREEFLARNLTKRVEFRLRSGANFQHVVPHVNENIRDDRLLHVVPIVLVDVGVDSHGR